MSARDFQLAFAGLIASPEICYKALAAEDEFFADFDLTAKEKKRLHSVVRQRGISACCSLYRMNRVTPLYSQLSNTCTLLGDQLVPLVEEFWRWFTKPSLQFREEVLEFANFIRAKIDEGRLCIPYLKDVLQLEMAMNELSYLPEGECRFLQFEYDIAATLQAIAAHDLEHVAIPESDLVYKLYIRDHEIEMDAL
jgi:hypothetical protein